VPKLVLIRHGESVWNKENRFTGWTDVGLTEHGEREARAAGRLLLEEGLDFDVAFTSVLKRAIKTLWLVMEEMERMWVPVQGSWRLNERHYGALQGTNKSEATQRFGAEQVQIWRRSYDVPPPPVTADDARYPGNHLRYARVPRELLPFTECLKDTVARVLPYWHDVIVPTIRAGERVLIASHGNSLRALVKYLDEVGDAEIVGLNIPTGIPLVYELDDDLRPLSHRYLGDPDAAARAAQAVADQSKAR